MNVINFELFIYLPVFVPEPEYDEKAHGQQLLTPEQIAADYVKLNHVVKSYPNLEPCRLVGPDVVNTEPNSLGLQIMQGYNCFNIAILICIEL